MRKLVKVLFVLVILGTVVFTSCKKYPEGPLVSLRTKTARVANIWKFEKVTINGTDQNLATSYWGLPPWDKWFWEMTKDNKVTHTWEAYSLFPAGSENGEWKFNDNKEKLLMKMNDETEWTEFEILKLKEGEIWLKESTTDTLYSGAIVTYASEYHLITK
ncbi:MAG: hypothetical protein HY958_09215 [Bacteroidia bacterium]|nr:hypothetical protein [Bacteroidia bacterium]